MTASSAAGEKPAGSNLERIVAHVDTDNSPEARSCGQDQHFASQLALPCWRCVPCHNMNGLYCYPLHILHDKHSLAIVGRFRTCGTL